MVHVQETGTFDGIPFDDINRENEVKSRLNEHAFQEFNMRRKYFFVLVNVVYLTSQSSSFTLLPEHHNT